MAAASRLLGTCTTRQFHTPPSSTSSFSTPDAPSNAWRYGRSAKMTLASGNGGGGGGGGGSQRQVAAKASAAVSESSVSERRKGNEEGVVLLAVGVADALGRIFKPVVRRKGWRLQVEMFVENGIINCRFFALIALFGSLLGSILCFVEGCLLVLESFVEFFHTMVQRSDQVEVIHLLIEALDSFLIGTAMMTFGVGMYGLFVSSKEVNKDKTWLMPEFSLFGLFPLKRLPSWVEMQCVSQAKSKIGHAVLILLQTGLLGNLKKVPMANGLDLACFAGTILMSSAAIFILSRLNVK